MACSARSYPVDLRIELFSSYSCTHIVDTLHDYKYNNNLLNLDDINHTHKHIHLIMFNVSEDYCNQVIMKATAVMIHVDKQIHMAMSMSMIIMKLTLLLHT